LRAPQKLKRIAFSRLFKQKFTIGSYGGVFGVAKKLEENPVHRCQKQKIKINPLPRSCPSSK
jgi:hypothetical protein